MRRIIITPHRQNHFQISHMEEVNRCKSTHGMSKDMDKKYGEPKLLRIDGNAFTFSLLSLLSQLLPC